MRALSLSFHRTHLQPLGSPSGLAQRLDHARHAELNDHTAWGDNGKPFTAVVLVP